LVTTTRIDAVVPTGTGPKSSVVGVMLMPGGRGVAGVVGVVVGAAESVGACVVGGVSVVIGVSLVAGVGD
jgi:hypothetical protein